MRGRGACSPRRDQVRLGSMRTLGRGPATDWWGGRIPFATAVFSRDDAKVIRSVKRGEIECVAVRCRARSAGSGALGPGGVELRLA